MKFVLIMIVVAYGGGTGDRIKTEYARFDTMQACVVAKDFFIEKAKVARWTRAEAMCYKDED